MNRKPSAKVRRLVAIFACLATTMIAQQQLDLTTIGQDPQWKIVNRTASVVEVKGKRAVKLSKGAGMGVVWLDGYDFVNGVIDVDILGQSQPVQGSFVGIVFHTVDAETHDAVYFRPFNFRAADRSAAATRYSSCHIRSGLGKFSGLNTPVSTSGL